MKKETVFALSGLALAGLSLGSLGAPSLGFAQTAVTACDKEAAFLSNKIGAPGKPLAAINIATAYKECLKQIQAGPDKALRFRAIMGRIYLKAGQNLDARLILEDAAFSSYNPALAALGQFYEFGWDVKKDLARAEAIYRQAHDNANHDGSVFLAQLLLKKRTAEARAEARTLLEDARKKGFSPATKALALAIQAGELPASGASQLTTLWNEAAQRGDPEAAYQKGLDFQKGRNGSRKSLASARQFFEKAVAGGHSDAMVSLGVLRANPAFSTYDTKSASRLLVDSYMFAPKQNLDAVFETLKTMPKPARRLLQEELGKRGHKTKPDGVLGNATRTSLDKLRVAANKIPAS